VLGHLVAQQMGQAPILSAAGFAISAIGLPFGSDCLYWWPLSSTLALAVGPRSQQQLASS